MRRCAILLVLLGTFCYSGYAQDTVQVYKGWNIVGSLGTGALQDVLVTEPPGIIISLAYAFKPGAGYESLDTLSRGVGYWVKVSGDGIIIFGKGSITVPCESLTVDYGGRTYRAVQIGTQCWMKENLNHGTMIDSLVDQTDNGVIEKYCYSDDTTNCNTYGGLYEWNEAMQYFTTPGSKGLCPPGWHIPTLTEFQTLSSNVAGDANALKDTTQGAGAWKGTNTSGFSALLAGYRDPWGNFGDLGYYMSFWTSSEFDATYAQFIDHYANNGTLGLSSELKEFGFSIRCLKD